MMPSGIHTVDINVQHVGQPGDRVPITGMGRCNSPEKAFFVYSIRYIGILRYVFVIVIAYKFMRPCLCIDWEGDEYKKHSQYDIPFSFNFRF